MKASLIKKHQEKIEWIRKKRRNQHGGDSRGIEVQNVEVTKEFTSEPRLYGEEEVNEDEVAL